MSEACIFRDLIIVLSTDCILASSTDVVPRQSRNAACNLRTSCAQSIHDIQLSTKDDRNISPREIILLSCYFLSHMHATLFSSGDVIINDIILMPSSYVSAMTPRDVNMLTSTRVNSVVNQGCHYTAINTMDTMT